MTKVSSNMGRVGVVVAARCASTRLPRKVLRPLGGKPMILYLLERIQAATAVDEIILTTTKRNDDDELAECVASAGFPVFRGADSDVVQRYVETAELFHLDYVVRVTGDCPFVDSTSLDYCMTLANDSAPFDLASTKSLFPIGIDYEIYSAKTMAALHYNEPLSVEEREHLTLFMYRNKDRFKLVELQPRPDWRTSECFTVDTLDDYRRACALADRVGCNASIADLVDSAT